MYRISELLKLERKVYHTNDLAILWGITNKNTLYTTIKRYVQKGVLIPIYKGFYSIVPLSALNPIELGKSIIHRYTYLSTESVLAQAGVISQTIYLYTFVSDLPKKVSVGSMSFLFRRLKAEYLNNPSGVINRNGTFIASTERAVADMLYFNPKYHFDLPQSIDFEKVRLLQKEIGYSC
jgi:predicted transcriptional regulator of viral defense system